MEGNFKQLAEFIRKVYFGFLKMKRNFSGSKNLSSSSSVPSRPTKPSSVKIRGLTFCLSFENSISYSSSHLVQMEISKPNFTLICSFNFLIEHALQSISQSYSLPLNRKLILNKYFFSARFLFIEFLVFVKKFSSPSHSSTSKRVNLSKKRLICLSLFFERLLLDKITFFSVFKLCLFFLQFIFYLFYLLFKCF